MDNEATNLFGTSVDFPAIPKEKIPDSANALRHIVAGQRGLRQFYVHLEGLLTGEVHCLAVLLRRDWERRFGALLLTADELLESLGTSDGVPGMLPVKEQIDAVVRGLQNASPERVLETTRTFAARALLCYQMVPWVSEVKEIHDFFRASVEAEDSHMAVLDLFGDLIQPVDSA